MRSKYDVVSYQIKVESVKAIYQPFKDIYETS